MSRDRINKSIYNPRSFRGAPPLGEFPSRGKSRGKLIVGVAIGLLIGFGFNYWANGKFHISEMLERVSYEFARLRSGVLQSGSLSAPSAAGNLPVNGTTTWFISRGNGTIEAPMHVLGDKDMSHCTVKLYDWGTGAPVVELFVRAGQEAQVSVPIGKYRGSVLCNAELKTQLFARAAGEEYFIEPLVFSAKSPGLTIGKTIDLTRRIGGNLHTSKSPI